MKKEMYWAYLIHLSSNMWADPGAKSRYATYSDHLLCDDDVWREVVDFLPEQGFNTLLIDVGDAIQYESHPEISIKGAWSKDKLKKELDRLRSIGLKPLPKLNFSTCHDTWLGDYARMVSSKPYYQVCADLIQEVAELFDYPELFHLGMDEEDLRHQQNYRYCCIRQGDLWWEDLYRLFDVCEKVGVRPWIWADYVRNHRDEFLEKMPKSAMLSNWEYRRFERLPDGTYDNTRYNDYVILDKAGFDQIPTGSTCFGVPQNMENTMQLGIEDLNPDLVKGYMTAPWFFTIPSDIHMLKHDALRFGLAKKKMYPEY